MHKNIDQSRTSCDALLRITGDALPLGTLKLLLGVTVRVRYRRVHTVEVLER
jgi:hypothetical protein